MEEFLSEWEQSEERRLSRRYHEDHKVRGEQQEQDALVRAGLQTDLRANSRFSDQTGIPLWGLFGWGELW